MSSTTFTTSTFTPNSSLSVAGQQWSSTVSPDMEETALSLSTVGSSESWDSTSEGHHVQEIEIVYPFEDYDSTLSSAPLTPDLTWDSQPSTGTDFSEEQLKSVFEDWDDAFVTNPETPSQNDKNGHEVPRIQVVEEDGSQVLLIPAESDFYNEPEAPKNSLQLHFTDLPELPSRAVIMTSPGGLLSTLDSGATPSPTPATLMRKGSEMMLFVDTSMLSASINSTTGTLPLSYFSPACVRPGVEESTWVPKDSATYRLDIPMDCHCTATPIEQLQSNWN